MSSTPHEQDPDEAVTPAEATPEADEQSVASDEQAVAPGEQEATAAPEPVRHPPAGGTTAASARRAARDERVRAAARDWRRRLIDLGGPNTLLWYQDLPTGTLDLTTAHPGGVSMLMAGRATRLSDLVREPSAFREVRRRAEAIREKALELESERGLVTGFMAIGMATWEVAGIRRAPAAPVLLRRVTLHPTDPAHRDYDIDLDPVVELNPVLVHYLASEQGVRFDPQPLAELAHSARRFDPMPVFRELARLCRGVTGFRIADRKVISTFPYAKLPLVADLTANDLLGSEAVAALAGVAPAACRSDEERDDLVVLDLDAHQRRVVDTVRAGDHAVVAGAPGTGRTQTVAALAAALSADGRSVLVVAERRTPLRDLLQRLDDVGLRDLALDLREGALERGGLARDVVETLDGLGPAAPEPDLAARHARVAAHAERLDAHRDALHRPRDPWGVSVFDARCALARLVRGRRPPTSTVRLSGAVLEGVGHDDLGTIGETLTDIAAHGAWTEDRAKDPWAGARLLTEEDATRAAELTTALAGGRLEEDRTALDGVLASVGLPRATTPADWRDRLALLRGVRDSLGVFVPEVFTAPLDDYVGATGDRLYRHDHDVRGAWWTRRGRRRDARSLLREDHRGTDLHALLEAARDQEREWRRLSGGASTPRESDGLDEAVTRWERLENDLRWLEERLVTTDAGPDLLDRPLDELRERLAGLAARRDRLGLLPHVTPRLDDLAARGLAPLTFDLAQRRVAPENVSAEWEFVWWRSVLDTVAAADPLVGEHDGEALRDVVDAYARDDRELVAVAADVVRARRDARLRDAMRAHPEQVELLRVEARRRRHHLATRDLVEQCGDVLAAARPVWVASPLVVASVVPPESRFDVVVVEDAAGVSPAALVGALARAHQVVAVGDPVQLGPTPFTTSAPGGDAPEVDELAVDRRETSAMDVLAPLLPRHDLRRAYRARDERAVAFASAHLYGGELEGFPGASGERLLTLASVDAPELADDDVAPDPEGLEIARVVDVVLDHARRHPGESLGVVTFTPRAARRIAKALRVRLDAERDPAVFEHFDERREEPFVIAHVDRMRGESRDAIVLAVGAATGSSAGRRVRAVSGDEGRARLAVALGTSRGRLTVVSSLTADDLDSRGLASQGSRLLRDLLAYAASGGEQDVLRGQAAQSEPGEARRLEPPAPVVDPVMAEFAVRLRQEGLVVHEQYGSGRDRVDLAVEDPYTPGRMSVAVESDGRRYAAVPDVRERERLRAAHLEDLGWGYVRVWSADLVDDPARDVARVLDAVREADERTPWSGHRRSGLGGNAS